MNQKSLRYLWSRYQGVELLFLFTDGLSLFIRRFSLISNKFFILMSQNPKVVKER